MRVVPEGGLLALGLVVVAVGLSRKLGWIWSLPWVVLAGAVAFFFRDPDRTIPSEPGLVVAPADGTVTAIERVPDQEQPIRVSIFLGLRDVHVFRSPIGGRVARVVYKRGRFVDAEDPTAYAVNEQNRVRIADGPTAVDYVQIAGLIARRIVCWIGEGDAVERGQRVGLIRFGSRADLYLPQSAVVLVCRGMHVRAGADAVARLAAAPN